MSQDEQWSREFLLSLSREDLALLFARAAASVNGHIARLSTQYGECYRVQAYTSDPQDRRLSASIRAAITYLDENGYADKTGDAWQLTADGYEWTEDSSTVKIDSEAAAILDILLRVRLAPHLWEDTFEALPALERDESLDAFSQGAVLLPQLVWEWAGTVGQVPLTFEKANRIIDVDAFYSALSVAADIITIELSVPTRSTTELLPPFPGQRVHVVNRTKWLPFSGIEPVEDRAVEDDTYQPDIDDESLPDLPVFTDPHTIINGQRVGYVWVRARAEDIDELRKQPLSLLDFAVKVADLHANHLRDHVNVEHESDPGSLNAVLGRISSWQRLLHRFEEIVLTQADPERAAVRFFEGLQQPLPRDERATALKERAAKLDEIRTARAYGRWHDQTRRFLERYISASVAREFMSLFTASDDDVAKRSREAREYLFILRSAIEANPDDYRPESEVDEVTPASIQEAVLRVIWPRKKWLRWLLLAIAAGLAVWMSLPDAIKIRSIDALIGR